MKKTLFFVVISLMANLTFGQQDEQYTQFMFNKLVYNSAYAGADAPFSANVIFRRQWLGFEGAPTTQALSLDKSLANNRIGLGASIIRNSIGVSDRITATAAYAYRFQVGSGKLSFGLNGSIRYINHDYRDEKLRTILPIHLDNSIPMDSEVHYAPNFGASIYYYTQKIYLGFSVPRLMARQISDQNGNPLGLAEARHFYVMGGVNFQAHPMIEITPQLLIQYADDLPLGIDLNTMTTIAEKYKVGLTYRLGGDKTNSVGESLDIMAGLPITKSIFFGVSYDYTLSKLKTNSNGSIEAILQYRIHDTPGVETMNPRYF